MNHPMHRVHRFEIEGPYTVAIEFTDGTQQRIDFRSVLEGALFGPLQDLALFNAVTLDPEAGTLAWPNGADFDPTTLYDWPAVSSELVARARVWAAEARTTAQAG